MKASLHSERAWGTTVYLARFDRRRYRPRIALLSPSERAKYCLSGGFFVHRSVYPGERPGQALGEIWIGGHRLTEIPFAEPWDQRRGALGISGSAIELAPRSDLSAENILQAGPLLARDGVLLDYTHEGFSQDQARFDSDITAARHPRGALGISPTEIMLLATDGRAPGEAGLLLEEVAQFLLEAGARDVLNLDGGESVSLFFDHKLQNTPRNLLTGESLRQDRSQTPTSIILEEI